MSRRLSVLLLLTAVACGDAAAPPAPAQRPASPPPEASFYPSIFAFRKGEVGLDRTLRERRPAMILFTDDG